MRVWLPVTVEQIAAWQSGDDFTIVDGIAVTAQWASQFDDDDPEVLEDEALQVAGTGIAVVVVEAPATVINSENGSVRLDAPINKRQIQAFFAKSSLADEDLLWFGPTEALELLDFVRGAGQ